MNSYVNMGVGALLGTVFVLMSVSIASEGIFHSGHPEKEGFAIVAEEGGGEGAGGAAIGQQDEGVRQGLGRRLAQPGQDAGGEVLEKRAVGRDGEPARAGVSEGVESGHP